MRALRVVGLTEDGEVVLEDPVRLERFRVPADERLRAAARGDLSRLGQIAIELESQLRPREIQARIRAGASVEQVAAAAGVPEQKIERFAYPVLLERFRTAENAQRAHPVRADGPDNRTLAEVVAHTFGLRGQAYEGARWDSWKGEDGRWVVALSWRAGRSDNRAHWTFQPGAHGGTVTALDEHASDLVEGLPARPLRTVGAVVDMNRPEEEEPPPAPSPVEQWRAAASDSYRERVPHAPEPARPAGERGGARTAEPWRPAPAQRQAEPVDARTAEQRTPHRGEARPAAEPRDNGYRAATSEWAPGERGAGVERREAVLPAPARPERPQPPQFEPARSQPAWSEPAWSEPAWSEPGPAAARPAPAPDAPAAGADAGTGEAAAPQRERYTADARPTAALDPSPSTAPAPPLPDATAAPAPEHGAHGPGPAVADACAPDPAAGRAAELRRPPAEGPGRTDATPATGAAATTAVAEVAAATEVAGGVESDETAEIAEVIEPAETPDVADTTAAATTTEVPESVEAADTAEVTETAGALAAAEVTETGKAADTDKVAATGTVAEATGSSETTEATDATGTAEGPAAGEATEASGADAGAPATPATREPAAGKPAPQPAAADRAPQEPAADAPPAGRRTRKGKPVMPSWDEVLLGVRGPR